METLNLQELLKTKTRQEVCDILVRYTFARDQPHARQIIAITLGESDGDVIRLPEDGDDDKRTIGTGPQRR